MEFLTFNPFIFYIFQLVELGTQYRAFLKGMGLIPRRLGHKYDLGISQTRFAVADILK